MSEIVQIAIKKVAIDQLEGIAVRLPQNWVLKHLISRGHWIELIDPTDECVAAICLLCGTGADPIRFPASTP